MREPCRGGVLTESRQTRPVYRARRPRPHPRRPWSPRRDRRRRSSSAALRGARADGPRGRCANPPTSTRPSLLGRWASTRSPSAASSTYRPPVPSAMTSSFPSGRAQSSGEQGAPADPTLWNRTSPFGLRATRAASPSQGLTSKRSLWVRHFTSPERRSTVNASRRARSGRSGSCATATAHTVVVRAHRVNLRARSRPRSLAPSPRLRRRPG